MWANTQFESLIIIVEDIVIFSQQESALFEDEACVNRQVCKSILLAGELSLGLYYASLQVSFLRTVILYVAYSQLRVGFYVKSDP